MIRSIVLATCAIALGIIVSPLLAVAVGVTVGFLAFVDFWLGLIGTIKNRKTEDTSNIIPIESIWEKHAKDRGLYEDEPAFTPEEKAK